MANKDINRPTVFPVVVGKDCFCLLIILSAIGLLRRYPWALVSFLKKSVHNRDYPNSKKFGKWMGPIWTAQLGESLVMLIGPSWIPNSLPYWEPNSGPIRERRCLP